MKQKACKICKNKFLPERQMQSVCSYECSIEYGKKHLSNEVKEKKKQDNKAKKEFNQKDRTLLKKKVQTMANKYARLRDFYINGSRCVTCDSTSGKRDGGHFLPTSSYSAVRYNTNQIFQQCVKCNQYNGGMPKEYRNFMVNQYGESYVIKMEDTKNQLRNYSTEYYLKYIKTISKKIKKVEIKIKNML